MHEADLQYLSEPGLASPASLAGLFEDAELARQWRRLVASLPPPNITKTPSRKRRGQPCASVSAGLGSGKTALTLACARALRDKYDLCVVTNDIYTAEDAQFLVRNKALIARPHHRRRDRRLPHTAIREDASINLRGSGSPDPSFSRCGADLRRIRRR